jgi:hypothetical protein
MEAIVMVVMIGSREAKEDVRQEVWKEEEKKEERKVG